MILMIVVWNYTYIPHFHPSNRKDTHQGFAYISKPGSHDWFNKTGKVETEQSHSQADKMEYAMFVSTGLLMVQIASIIYNHSLSMCLSIALPFETHVVLSKFHKGACFFLASLCLSQIFFSTVLGYLSFYLICSQTKMLDIFTNAAGILFINSIPSTIGNFMKIWLMDDKEGFRILKIQSQFRPQVELFSKMICYVQIIMILIDCRYEWGRDQDFLFFKKNIVSAV